MKNTLFLFCFLGSLCAFPQSSTLITPNGNIGIFSKNNTTVLDDPGAVQPPVSGAGTRLMWIPAKSAFRAGTVTGTQWDVANIGAWSTAMGYNTTASSDNSTAMGAYSTAGGNFSTAMGFNAKAWGSASTAFGNSTTASGSYSTAMGFYTTASGFSSTAMGSYTTAQSENSLVIGSYNLIAGNYNSWIATDPLFVIGNGTADNTRNNAVTVLKNGRMGIGTPTPDSPLHITGTASSTPSRNRVYFNADVANFVSGESGTGNIKVHADGWYWAEGGGFVATSDARIKNILGRTNTTDDLEKLRKIAVTDYRYIDEVSNGSTLQKKVIAQQLKEIFPIAVNQTKGFIPNVYQAAQKVSLVGHTTQIVTTKAHDFQTGDVVKLIVENEGEKVIEVNVTDSHTFSVAQPFKDRVFVYGKQVSDLHNVDYDAISMLNVSATQELAQQVDALKAENASLRNSMNEMAIKVAELDELKSQMASLKSLLLKTDNAQERSSVSENKK